MKVIGLGTLNSRWKIKGAAIAIVVAAGATAGIGSAALAADVAAPFPAYTKAPAAAYNWTGCYIGVHAGGGVMNDTWIGTTTATGGGGLAGGQAGCNYQSGQFVFGLEGEGAWSGIRDDFNLVEGNLFSSFQSVRNRWDADLAVRLGFAIDRALVYGKMGAALGNFEFANTNTNPFLLHGQSTLVGLMLGAGLEYAFAPNWSAKLEYDFIDFVGKDVRFDGMNDEGPFTEILTVSARKQIVKVGVNYKFGQ
jgi:outer membrane immunogenic protein